MTFDPYHKWLGIPKSQRPPNHYQLLGVTVGEQDREVIEAAALQRVAFVRNYQAGPHGAVCAKILNEIAAARNCLLDPKKREAYDATLAQSSAAKGSTKLDFVEDALLDEVAQSGTASRSNRAPILAAGGLVAVMVGGGAYFALRTGDKPEDKKPSAIAGREPSEVAPKPAKGTETPVAKPTVADPKPLPPPPPIPPSKGNAPIVPQKNILAVTVPKKSLPAPIGAVVGKSKVEKIDIIPGDELEKPYEIGRLRNLPTEPTALAFDAKRNLVVVGMANGDLLTIDKEEGGARHTLKGHTNAVVGISLASEAGRFATVGADGNAFVWDMESGNQLLHLDKGKSRFSAVALSTDGAGVLVGDVNGQVEAYEVASEKSLARLVGHQKKITFVAWAGGDQVVSASEDKTARLWKRTGQSLRVFQHEGAVETAWLSPQGNRLLCLDTGDQSIRSWDLEKLKELPSFETRSKKLVQLASSDDGRWLVTAGADGKLRVWLTGTRQERYTTNVGVAGGYRCVALDPDGKWAFTGSPDSIVRIWSLPDPEDILPPNAPAFDRTRFGDVSFTFVKVPPPDEAARKTAAKEIQEIHKQEFAKAKSNPDERIQLAMKLRTEATGTRNNPAAQFILFERARDLAIDAGNPDLAFAATEDLLRRFEAPESEYLIETAQRLGPKVKPSDSANGEKLTTRLFNLATDLFRADDFSAANRMASFASANARKFKLTAQDKKVVALIKAIKDAQKAFDKVADAKKKLEEDPKDKSANSEYGRYVCLVKGDWTAGLPILAIGADAALAKLASTELASGENTDRIVEAAEGWWKSAESAKGVEKLQLQRHAVDLYKRALPTASGVDRARIESRINSVPANEESVFEMAPTKPTKTKKSKK